MNGTKVRRIMIGTAGHIDHGKSSLVRALTGTDPDRLKEEKERGLTIDIGRAVLTLPDGRKVGIIDVPGHEKFIKNMVAGAVSVDLALLVVAADDGVMPQTREHMEILVLLGIKKCVVALTKIDIVDRDMAELARDDVERFLETTPLKGSPVVPVSSVTGEGIDKLKEEIFSAVMEVEPPGPEGLFRLPIQRIFSIEGFGPVVGGVPMAGSARKGDQLEVLPPGIKARVRGIQVYGEPADVAVTGESCALNMPDVDMERVERGHFVVAAGYFVPESHVYVSLKMLDSSVPIKSGSEVRFHIGTAEILGRVFLPGGGSLGAGEKSFARIQLADPTVMLPGDSDVLRLQAPPRTLGGGRVIIPERRKMKIKGEWLETLGNLENSLENRDSRGFLEEVIRFNKLKPVEARVLSRLVGRKLEDTRTILEDLENGEKVIRLGKGYVHKASLEKVKEDILAELGQRAEADPLCPEVGKQEIASSLRIVPEIIEKVISGMEREGSVEIIHNTMVRLKGKGAVLSDKDNENAEMVLLLLKKADCQALTEKELLEETGLEPSYLSSLVAHLVSNDKIKRVGGSFLYHIDCYNHALEELIKNCRRYGCLNIPEYRNTLKTTRKYVIPLLEHFDGLGITARKGSNRVLKNPEAFKKR